MCGISGIWNFGQAPVPATTIRRFNDAIRHRGPDGDGIFLDEAQGLALAHRRLSILDLSDAGHQPMKRDRYVISFNGEVYNFLELRQELKALGHAFHSDCDTEVILAAWQQWGSDALSRFNGMWAFALWDSFQQELILCRDRYGVKPLYYVYQPGKLLAFASETIAFKQLEGFERELDRKHLSRGLQNVFELESLDQTIFRGVEKLHAGSLAIIDRKGNMRKQQWWRTEQSHVEVPTRYEDQVEAFRELFRDACAIRLRSDVPLATALSGGLDSSSVYCQVKQLFHQQAAVARLPQDWQKAVVATFPGTAMDEKAYAQDVINHTQGQAIFIEPDLKTLGDQIISEVKQEDFIYSSPPIVHMIYKAMKDRGVSVSLDGHGVDEMIYGYPFDILNAFRHTRDYQRKLELLQVYSGLTNISLSKLRKTHLDGKLRRAILSRINRRFQRTKATEPWVYQQGNLADAKEPYQSSDPFYNIPYQLFHQSSMPTLLRNWDVASSRHGVEIRMPFMDYRLVSFVFSLPFESKVGEAYSKRILRDAMKGVLPESIRTRTYKIGINAPMPEWFAGSLNPMVMDTINSAAFRQSDLWDGNRIQQHFDKVNRTGNWQLQDCFQLWPILNAWLIMND